MEPSTAQRTGPTHDDKEPASDPYIGQTVGRVRVIERVAKGALASVYRGALQDGSGAAKEAALKVYRTDLPRESWAPRVQREAQSQRGVDHPCVARLLDRGEHRDGALFLASEWVEGERLEDRLQQGAMGWPAIEPILRDVARGLVAIHEAGVIHRDLKPSNILLPVTGAPAAVIVDFGHSLVVDDERLTDQGWTLGSASYMAPEQAAGEELDARTDLYALGVVLYRALTGHFPFVHGSPAEVMSQHLREPAIPPRDRAPERDISRESEELCLWMLAKDRSARLPNAHVLHLTLKAMTHAGRR